jgi:hypothetical protein
LKGSLAALLEYLRDKGRTNANCWAVDLFFCTSEGWERDWTEQNLPGDFHDVLSLMGQALHDTARTPNIAEDFDCLPEQLLDRVRRLCPLTSVNGDLSPTGSQVQFSEPPVRLNCTTRMDIKLDPLFVCTPQALPTPTLLLSGSDKVRQYC